MVASEVTTMNIEPRLDRRVSAILGEALLRVARLEIEEAALYRLLLVVLTVAGVLIVIDAAVAFVFNQTLVGDLRQELSTADQVARAIASLMMVSVLSAAVFLWHVAFHHNVHGALRVGSFVVGTLVAIGAALVSAGVALPVFRDLFRAVLSEGPLVPAAMAMSESEVAQLPLAARWLAAVPLVGIGLFIGALELAALDLHDRIRVVRGELARYQKTGSLATAAAAALDRARALEEQCAAHALPLVKQAQVLVLTTSAINYYLRVIAQSRPSASELCLQKPPERELATRVEACASAARTYLRDDRLVELVRSQLRQGD
jgi:hypothetical protein